MCWDSDDVSARTARTSVMPRTSQLSTMDVLAYDFGPYSSHYSPQGGYLRADTIPAVGLEMSL